MKKQIQPTLIIGLGGTGTMAVSVIKKLANIHFIDPNKDFPLLKFLAIDTEFMTKSKTEEIKSKYSHNSEGSHNWDSGYEKTFELKLEDQELLLLEFQKSQMEKWLQDPKQLTAEDFVSSENLGRVINSVMGDGAGGYGIVGKMALWQNLDKVKKEIENQIKLLLDSNYISQKLDAYKNDYELAKDPKLSIFVICSISGGTGKGAFLTIGAIINEILKQQTGSVWDGTERYLIDFMPSCFAVKGRNVGTNYLRQIKSNHYASCKELEHVLLEGYPLEEKLKSILGLSQSQTVSEKIYTNVLNISPCKSNNSWNVGNYETVDKIVAETVLGYIFGGIVSDFRAFFRSNKGAFINSNTLTENASSGTETKRLRDYGRIGRYKLTYPVNQLIRFAEQYYNKQIAEDMLEGHLINIPEKKQKNPSDLATSVSQRFLSDSKNIFVAQNYFSIENIKQFCSTFEDNWILKIQEATQNRYERIANDFVKNEQGTSQIDFKIEKFVENQNDEFIKQLQDYVKDYGLKKTDQVLLEVIYDFEECLTNVFKHFLTDDDLNNEDKKVFTFENTYDRIFQVFDGKKSEEEKNFKNYYGEENEHLVSVRNFLQGQKEAWKQQNKGFFNKFKGETSKEIDDLGPVLSWIKTSQNSYDKFAETCYGYVMLKTIKKFYDKITKTRDIILKNSCVLETKDNSFIKGGLLYDYKNRKKKIADEPKDGLEIRIKGNSFDEFHGFALSLKINDEVVSDRIQRELNKNFMNRLIVEEITPEEFRKTIENETREIRTLENKFSVCGELQNLIYKGKSREAEKFVSDLLKDASLLGAIDVSKVKGGGSDFGQKISLIQVENVDLLNQHFNHIIKDEKVVFAKNREEIILTIFETALPLFVFEELYLCQNTFFELKKSNQNVLFEHHSHKNFVNLPQPFGNSSQVSSEDVPALINLLLHTGVMKLEKSYIKIRKQSYGDLNDEFFKNYEDLRKKDAVDKRLHISDFEKHFNENGSWFYDFAKELSERFRLIFVSETEAKKNYLKKYFLDETASSKGFPYIPETLLAKIVELLEKQPNDNPSQDLLRFINDNKINNLSKIRRIKGNRNCQTCSTIEKLSEIYEKFDFSHFESKEKNSTEHTKKPKKYWIYQNGNQVFKTTGEVIEIIETDKKIKIHDGVNWLNWKEYPEISDLYEKSKVEIPPPPPPPEEEF